ncbi:MULTISPECIES: hypothetical protein [Zobellia]|uniref:hypothetical protein n=1 Tax=Zobellia TaxID=112040 RepID=UPI0025922FDF|nr:hypothetical protein [Zobellia sp. 1_MG-2023]MDO6821302.1 hypothetical protein [Zobellia sp. 1_MG-2023]
MSTIIKSSKEGLNNEVQQNRGLGNEYERQGNTSEEVGKPVDNGGVSISVDEEHLRKQWLAVRDEYLANFPELDGVDDHNEKDNIGVLINSLAKKRQQTPETIQHEIMNWSASK